MEITLDVKDKKILAILDMDARMPVTQIARKVGLSREVVDYRIKQLEKKGVIEGYYTAIDITKLGFMYCRVFLKYRQMNNEKEKELMEYCQKSKVITWVALGQGKWDITIVIVTKSIKEIERAYDALIDKFGTYFQNPYMGIAFKIYHFPHSYLHDPKKRDVAVLGEKATSIKLDKLDQSLLDLLTDNANASLLDLAKKLKSTSKVISYRLKKLVENKIILAFRAKINSRLFGYDHYKVFLNLQKSSKTDLNRIINYLENQPNVIYITKPMGTYNLEFEIMIKGTNKLYEFMREFIFNFSDIITDYETILYYSEPMLEYLSPSVSD